MFRSLVLVDLDLDLSYFISSGKDAHPFWRLTTPLAMSSRCSLPSGHFSVLLAIVQLFLVPF